MLTDPLKKREVFHLIFLRALLRSVPVSGFALKGGSNLRFFFESIRYSEDMDLDAAGIPVHDLREKVGAILASAGLQDTLRTFGIERPQPQDLSRAKQTETVQRFKVHLLTTAGEDLFTQIEFSRRGLDSPVRAESVSPAILAAYRLPPIIVPHYTAIPAARQKIRVLFARRQPEARDVFDLYMLSSQSDVLSADLIRGLSQSDLRGARDRIYEIEYPQYRDTVVSFLDPKERTAYESRETWDEMRLRVAELIERWIKNGR